MSKAKNNIKEDSKLSGELIPSLLPPDYDPDDDDDYMGEKQLEYFRMQLIAWRNELLCESSETIDHMKSESLSHPDIVDRASVETGRAFELRTRDRYRKLINKIDLALERIQNGQYGYCEETGDKIGIKRLKARPIATLSVKAQERHEREERLTKGD